MGTPGPPVGRVLERYFGKNSRAIWVKKVVALFLPVHLNFMQNRVVRSWGVSFKEECLNGWGAMINTGLRKSSLILNLAKDTGFSHRIYRKLDV
jgi:hypothetical protein